MKTWADKSIQCEDMKHYLVKKNLKDCIEKILETKNQASYLACPHSPFMHLTVETAEIFVKFLQDLIKENDYQILTNLEPDDYYALSNLPDNLRVKFFEVLKLEMPKDFEYQLELGLDKSPYSVVKDLN